MTWAEFLPLVFLAVMGLALLAYVVLDGYDLGVGMLMHHAKPADQDDEQPDKGDVQAEHIRVQGQVEETVDPARRGGEAGGDNDLQRQ